MAGLLGQRIFVSHDQLKRLGWNNITDKMVNELNRVLDIYEITTPSSICHFLSQCYIESDRGKAPAEYGDGSRYENRIDIGNVETGDGPKFKGGGYIQLTGRNNYTVFSNAMKDPKILDEGSAYVAVYYPWESAAFFWTKITNLNVRANNGASVTEITKVVNGGYAALEERKDAYNKCLQVIY
jgi:predicted chitinase